MNVVDQSMDIYSSCIQNRSDIFIISTFKINYKYFQSISLFIFKSSFKQINILQTYHSKLLMPIRMALSLLTAPPMKPLAWTKSMSSIWDNPFSFYMSFIPLHSAFRGSLSSNEVSFRGTAWILHFWPFASGKTI